jgi:hypothetical protein
MLFLFAAHPRAKGKVVGLIYLLPRGDAPDLGWNQ